MGDLSAEEKETIDFDCLGKRADRRREFRRGNCGLAHSKLLRILGYLVRMMEPEVASAGHLAQAHLIRPDITDLDRCPVQRRNRQCLPNLNCTRHRVSVKCRNST